MAETFEDVLKRQENELPRLPVPPLQQTMDKFLVSTKPFLTEDEYQTTEKIAKEFFNGDVAAKLQNLLEERARNTKNWLSEYWLNAAYLDNRSPLPVYSSTSAINSVEQWGAHYLNVAAAAICGSIDFKIKMVDENKIPPFKIGPFELCMAQCKQFFATNRIPGEKRDISKFHETSKHIIAARNNNFFMVPIFDKCGKPLNQSQVVAQLKVVEEQSQTPSNEPIGILTTERRDVWYKARESLLKASEENAKNLDLIESALCILALDKAITAEEDVVRGRLNAYADRYMHGGAVNVNEAANRWMDSVCQFIVMEGAETIGMCIEHSPIEANPVVYDHMYDIWKSGKDEIPPAGEFERPQKLSFTVPEDVRALIPEAFSNMRRLAESVEVNCCPFKGFGKELIKSWRLGTPDSVIQMALQLTFYKLHKSPGAQYESATTRGFLHGRTETIRSCSTESIHFARVMLNNNVSNQEKQQALKRATSSHREYTMSAMMGQGIDRHMLGLRMIAMENDIEVHKFFEDPGFTRSSYLRIASSQVPAKVDGYACFAPLVPDGYGCCYNPLDEQINFCVTAFNACPETSAAKFCEVLEESLLSIKDISA